MYNNDDFSGAYISIEGWCREWRCRKGFFLNQRIIIIIIFFFAIKCFYLHYTRRRWVIFSLVKYHAEIDWSIFASFWRVNRSYFRNFARLQWTLPKITIGQCQPNLIEKIKKFQDHFSTSSSSSPRAAQGKVIEAIIVKLSHIFRNWYIKLCDGMYHLLSRKHAVNSIVSCQW